MAVELPPNLQESVNSIIRRENFVTHNVMTRRINAEGSGYMGVLFAIDVQGKTANGDKELNIFVKNIIPNPERMTFYSVRDIYARETFAYKELSKILTQLQDNADIPEDQRFIMAKSYEECNPEAIILENLTARGFKMYNRMDVVSLEFAVESIKQLAKFHALTFVLKEKHPNFFEEKIISMKQPFKFFGSWHGLVGSMFRFTMSLLEEDVRNSLMKKILDIVDKYPKYMLAPTSVRTLCHGDYRHGNIMVKEIDGKPSEVIPVDYQILHYGCPVLDLLYFIFNGTDQEFRKNHLSHLKDIYFETMDDFLRTCEINPVWTREEFEQMFAEKLDFGLMINVLYVPFTFAAEDDVPDVTGVLADMSFKTDPRFKTRFRGVVEDFINWGYL